MINKIKSEQYLIELFTFELDLNKYEAVMTYLDEKQANKKR